MKYIGDGDDVLKYIFRLKKERGKEVYFLDFVTIGIVARTNVEGLRKIKLDLSRWGSNPRYRWRHF